MKRMPFLCAAVVALAMLAGARPADAQLELKWSIEGYYRTRAVALTHLAAESRPPVTHPVLGEVALPNIRQTSYLIHRLRLSPTLDYGGIAKLKLEINALDDVVWGDNNALSTAPLFAVNPTSQGFLGGAEKPSIELSRAWMEFMVPVGLVRVGRMPSHWGAGLLANGGGEANLDPVQTVGKPPRKHADTYFDDDFGDNHFGSTADRIVFATRPLTVYKTLKKANDTSSNLVVAYVYDKLTEAPFLFAEEDRRVRPFGQQGFLSRGAKKDDIDEHILVAAYTNPDWDQVRYTDELKFGTYWVFRSADEGFTEPSAGPPHVLDNLGVCRDQDGFMVDPAECVTRDEGAFVWIADFWYRVRYGAWYSEAEYLHIGGQTTGGVPFPLANRRKEADISGMMARVGYLTEAWDALVEVGWSSGDNDIKDRVLKQRPLHPDHNVGLILFEEIGRERSARAFGPAFFSAANMNGATGFMSNGGVLNAKYVTLKGRYRPDFGGFELIGQVLGAWVDAWSNAPNIWVCPSSQGGPQACRMSRYLGTEIDVAVKSRFAGDHLDVSLESGLLILGDPLKTRSDTGEPIADYPSTAFTLQARAAFVF